jgi:hypothetical protein
MNYLRNEQSYKRQVKYQSPSLVIFAEGNIFVKAAGTFPEKDGNTRIKKLNVKSEHQIQKNV